MEKNILRLKKIGLIVFFMIDSFMKTITGQEAGDIQELNYKIEEQQSDKEDENLREAKIGNQNYDIDYIVCNTLEGEEIEIPAGSTIYLSDQSSSDKKKNQILSIYITPDGEQKKFYISEEMIFDIVEGETEIPKEIADEVVENQEESKQTKEESSAGVEDTLEVEQGSTEKTEEDVEKKEAVDNEQSEEDSENIIDENNTIDGYINCKSIITTEDTTVIVKKESILIKKYTELILIPEETAEGTSTVFFKMKNGEIVTGTIDNDVIFIMGDADKDEFDRIYVNPNEWTNETEILETEEKDKEVQETDKEDKEVQETDKEDKEVQETDKEDKEVQETDKEDKEVQETDKEVQKNEEETKKTDTSKLILLQQTDYPDVPYDKSWTKGVETIEYSGCGVVSSAIIALNSKGEEKARKILGAKDNKDFIRKLAELFIKDDLRADNGTKCGASYEIYKVFGINEIHSDVSVDKMKEYLCQKYSDGTSKYFGICHCNAGLFTSGGHVITVVGFDEKTNEVIVFDPYKDRNIDIGTYSKYEGISYSHDKDEVRVQLDTFKNYAHAFKIIMLSNDDKEKHEKKDNQPKAMSR